MKVIIDIPEGVHKLFKNNSRDCGMAYDEMYSAIKNGTPIPDNATNSDVIKALFDVTEEHFFEDMVDVYGIDRTDDPLTFYVDWWDAPYQKGGK